MCLKEKKTLFQKIVLILFLNVKTSCWFWIDGKNRCELASKYSFTDKSISGFSFSEKNI
jgi:hypothetical protein